MPLSMSDVRRLATRAQDLGGSVLRGKLERGESGGWTVDGRPLEEVLTEYERQNIFLIALAPNVESAAATVKRTCRTCGREYEGAECPYCREARIRLRGE